MIKLTKFLMSSDSHPIAFFEAYYWFFQVHTTFFKSHGSQKFPMGGQILKVAFLKDMYEKF